MDYKKKLKGTVEVELRYRDGYNERTISITEKEKIDEFIGELDFQKKEPCKCKHSEEVIFYTEKKDMVRASICDHCLDVYGRNGMESYKMPSSFYSKFKEHLEEGWGKN